MKAQFFIISSVIMIYVIVLTFQYLAGFSDIRLSGIEEHQELSYINNVKDGFIQTLNTSNISNNGDMNKMVKDIDFAKNFFKQELLKKGIDFDSKFIFFSNSFESNDLSDWTSFYGTPQLVNYTAYDGVNSLYSNSVEYVTKNLSGVSEVYVRAYVNFGTMPLDPNIYYFINLYENGIQFLGLGLWNNNGVYEVLAYSNVYNYAWVSSGISINNNEWHYFELYWLENGTNSTIEAWYDGQLEINNHTIDSSGHGKLINQYNFGGVNIGGGGTPDLYVDCIAVSSDYVGDKCYPDYQNYFDFSMKTNEMYTETEFPYQEKIIPQLVWFNNFFNDTTAGKPTLFSLNWTDKVGLSGYIFSFDNCTGSFTNDTSWVPMTGSSNASIAVKIISTMPCTIRWQFYANDTYNKWNTSDIFSFPTSAYCYNISTCSNLNQANKVYCLNDNVSSVGTCFNILAKNITLDCKGYTINYSISSTGYAVNNTGYDFTKIKNCNIVQNSSGNSNHSIFFVNANNGTIQNNTINVYSLNWGNIPVYLQGSSFNNITNNIMTVYTGANNVIYLIWNSNYNTISNNILNAWSGWITSVSLRESNNNKVINNTMNSQGSNDAGVGLTYETNSYIVNNTFNTTGYAVSVESWYGLVSDYNHTVQNNTQRGKPVYYYFNNNSIVIQNDNNIGQLFIANSTNIVIRNVTLDKDGITFGLTTNSIIENSNITTDWNYGYGILFQSLSNNNTIRNNTITTFAYRGGGVEITGSNSTIIQNNTIKTSEQDANGIELSYSSFNTIKDNRIQTKYQYSGTEPYISADVIQLIESSGDIIYNNFFNESSSSKTYFVSGIYSNNWNITQTLGTNIIGGPYLGGNYWTNSSGNGYSDTCADANTDGFCDVPYILNYTGTTNNTDYLPLSKYFANINVLNIHFNEATGTTAHDSSGYGNNGIFYGETFNDGTSYSGSTPTDLHTASGYFGKALNFDGSNDYVNCGNDSSLNINGPFSISAWVYVNVSSSYKTIVRKIGSSTTDTNYALDLNGTNGVRFFVYNTSGSVKGITVGTSLVPFNSWTFISGTYDGSTFRIYINGIQETTTFTWSGTMNNTVGNLRIGSSLSANYFNGTIDEVRIWNRSLNSTEINAEMSSPIPVIRPLTSWSFEEPVIATYVNDTHIWVNGTYGSAISFDGDNDYVEIPDSSSLDINDNISITAWVYPKEWGASGMGRIVDKGPSYEFYVWNVQSAIKVWFNNGAVDATGNTNSLQLNKWQHVAFTYDRQNVRFYVDGSPVGSPSATSVLGLNDNSLFIGNNRYNARQFSGAIDEVRIWNRALTQAEILAEKSKG